jgi:hypothetical protein
LSNRQGTLLINEEVVFIRQGVLLSREGTLFINQGILFNKEGTLLNSEEVRARKTSLPLTCNGALWAKDERATPPY